MQTKAEIMVAALHVKLGAQTIELTLEEARALRNALNDALGPQVVPIRVYPYYAAPIPEPPLPWVVTYGGTSWR